MKRYSPQQVNEMKDQCSKLNIAIYETTTISDMETLIRHKLLNLYGTPVPRN